MFSLILFCALAVRGSLAVYSDYFPLPSSEGVTVLQSKQDGDVSLSYKMTDICERSYSGYVHLPASTLSDVEGPPAYPINMFFWFFPAREAPETAPLSIWIGGGPGESALAGAMLENGPCYVNSDGNGTRTNPFSRNNRVNMLYVDQPVGAGYSYSTMVNVTYSQFTDGVTPTDFSNGIGFTPNITVFPGTVSHPDLAFTANNSDIAAKAMWHFAQTWFDTFPIYSPANKSISLWTNSYGGYFGSATFRYWESQNLKIQSGELDAQYLNLDTLGIENGCIDAVSQAVSWPQYAFNNTYDLQMINETVYQAIVQNITDPENGCIATIQKCRELASIGDPQFYGNNQTVNDFCSLATQQCFPVLEITVAFANRNVFDVAQVGTQRFPGEQHIGFFNKRWVQQALGVPVNYTDNANLTSLYFLSVADPFRQTQANLEFLLANDIQVALVYGDRDSRCNWLGVENVSLTLDYPDAPHFRAAGYANLALNNDSHAGGVVRQYDGLSFTRVFDAGHQVSAFQPQAVAAVFDRVMFRRDVATGTVPIGTGPLRPHAKAASSSSSSGFIGRLRWGGRKQAAEAGAVAHYQSTGPASSFGIKNVLPPELPVQCNLWAMPQTCTVDQVAALQNGTAVTRDYIVIEPAA